MNFRLKTTKVNSVEASKNGVSFFFLTSCFVFRDIVQSYIAPVLFHSRLFDILSIRRYIDWIFLAKFRLLISIAIRPTMRVSNSRFSLTPSPFLHKLWECWELAGRRFPRGSRSPAGDRFYDSRALLSNTHARERARQIFLFLGLSRGPAFESRPRK